MTPSRPSDAELIASLDKLIADFGPDDIQCAPVEIGTLKALKSLLSEPPAQPTREDVDQAVADWLSAMKFTREADKNERAKLTTAILALLRSQPAQGMTREDVDLVIADWLSAMGWYRRTHADERRKLAEAFITLSRSPVQDAAQPTPATGTLTDEDIRVIDDAEEITRMAGYQSDVDVQRLIAIFRRLTSSQPKELKS